MLIRKMGWLAVVLGCVAAAHGASKKTIRIQGSNTMFILTREWAMAFQKKVAEVEISVEGGGSELGISGLIAGQLDIAAASRSMTEEEKKTFERKYGSPVRELVVALDGVGVYVHESNPVTSITLSQLQDILSGRASNWQTFGGANRRIDVYNRDPQSGTRAFMQEHVLKHRTYSPRAREVSSTELIIAAVSRNPGAVGYGGIAYGHGIRALRIVPDGQTEGVWPSQEEITSKHYPLARPLYFYTMAEGKNAVCDQFIDWTFSDEGAAIVAFVGYFPALK